jgi:hypothetical protein
LDATLSAEENTAPLFNFSIYPGHPAYNLIKARDFRNEIVVSDGDSELFRGFVYEIEKKFNLMKIIKCKGDLAYLNDSVLRPYSTIPTEKRRDVAPANPGAFFAWMIEQHNAQVEPEKQFVVGENYADNFGTAGFYRSSEKSVVIGEEMVNKLLNELGGLVRVRHVDGVRYIDYLTEWEDVNAQVFDFGVNLTDYTQTDDALNVKTVLIPAGATLPNTEYKYNNGYFKTTDKSPQKDKTYYTKGSDSNGYSAVEKLTAFKSGVTYYEYDQYADETNNQLNISIYPDGPLDAEGEFLKSGDAILATKAIEKYGVIVGTYENTNITVVENLVESTISELKRQLSPKTTLNVTAVDLSLINPEFKSVKIGEYVRVRSKPHGFDSYMLCTRINLNLNNPEISPYTLGETFDTLSGLQNKKINALNSTINQTYETAAAIAEEAKKNAIGAMGTVTELTDRVNSGEFKGEDGENGEDATVLRIESSRGTVFKNNAVDTVLSVVVYKGSKRITDITELKEEYGIGASLEWSWQRMDEYSFGTIPATDRRISEGGFKFTLSPEDVDTKVTLRCQLITDY